MHDAPSIPGYEILRELGHGGMGIVYLARQRSLDRLVAVKVLTPDALEDTKAFARLRKEAKLMRALAHPGIVRLLDLDLDGEMPYLGFEYVPGDTSLEALLRRGGKPAGETLDILAGIAGALAYMHAQRLLHRDLKPANILLDPKGQARLIDFGLARRVSPDETRQTQAGHVVGTLSYMAPEVMEGQEATAASDVYAWGLVAYEMLARRFFFTSLARDGQIPATERYRHPMPALAVRAPRAPRAAVDLVMTCLEREPRRRPTAAALVARLEKGLVSAETAASGASAPDAKGAGEATAGARAAALEAGSTPSEAGGSSTIVDTALARGGEAAAAAHEPDLGAREAVRATAQAAAGDTAMQDSAAVPPGAARARRTGVAPRASRPAAGIGPPEPGRASRARVAVGVLALVILATLAVHRERAITSAAPPESRTALPPGASGPADSARPDAPAGNNEPGRGSPPTHDDAVVAALQDGSHPPTHETAGPADPRAREILALLSSAAPGRLIARLDLARAHPAAARVTRAGRLIELPPAWDETIDRGAPSTRAWLADRHPSPLRAPLLQRIYALETVDSYAQRLGVASQTRVTELLPPDFAEHAYRPGTPDDPFTTAGTLGDSPSSPTARTGASSADLALLDGRPAAVSVREEAGSLVETIAIGQTGGYHPAHPLDLLVGAGPASTGYARSQWRLSVKLPALARSRARAVHLGIESSDPANCVIWIEVNRSLSVPFVSSCGAPAPHDTVHCDRVRGIPPDMLVPGTNELLCRLSAYEGKDDTKPVVLGAVHLRIDPGGAESR